MINQALYGAYNQYGAGGNNGRRGYGRASLIANLPPSAGGRRNQQNQQFQQWQPGQNISSRYGASLIANLPPSTGGRRNQQNQQWQSGQQMNAQPGPPQQMQQQEDEEDEEQYDQQQPDPNQQFNPIQAPQPPLPPPFGAGNATRGRSQSNSLGGVPAGGYNPPDPMNSGGGAGLPAATPNPCIGCWLGSGGCNPPNLANNRPLGFRAAGNGYQRIGGGLGGGAGGAGYLRYYAPNAGQYNHLFPKPAHYGGRTGGR